MRLPLQYWGNTAFVWSQSSCWFCFQEHRLQPIWTFLWEIPAHFFCWDGYYRFCKPLSLHNHVKAGAHRVLKNGRQSAIGSNYVVVATNVLLVWWLYHMHMKKNFVILLDISYSFCLFTHIYICTRLGSNTAARWPLYPLAFTRHFNSIEAQALLPRPYLLLFDIVLQLLRDHNPTLLADLTTAAITNARPVSSTGAGACKKWCNSHSQPWSKKCTWSSKCDGCPECSGAQWLFCASSCEPSFNQG